MYKSYIIPGFTLMQILNKCILISMILKTV